MHFNYKILFYVDNNMRIKNSFTKFIFATLLIILLFGYKYIINIPQSLQAHIMTLHQLPTTQFNLLYSLQTLPILFLIIPLGIFYDTFGPKILIPASLLLAFGQFLLLIYTPLHSSFSFIIMIIGRVFQGIGAQILYLGQGTLATKWMGNLVGMIVVLPEVGEISNVFLSPILYLKGGLGFAMLIGFIFCIISSISSIILLWLDRKCQKQYNSTIQKQKKQSQQISQITCKTLKKFPKLFWILILICAINESIYLPFMDNANILIQLRFCIPYQKTGEYLSLPFIAAIITTGVIGFSLHKFKIKYIALISACIGVLSHYMIYTLDNCQNNTQQNSFMVAIAFIIFGIGFGSYYATIYPLVGLSVSKQYRGTGYSIVSFVQAIGMSVIPELSGMIIEKRGQDQLGYKYSSLLFILLSLIGLIVSIILCNMNDEILNSGKIGSKQEYSVVMTSNINLQGGSEQGNNISIQIQTPRNV